MRGGGWGVIVSSTFKTSPTFNATHSTITPAVSNDTVACPRHGARATQFRFGPITRGAAFIHRESLCGRRRGLDIPPPYVPFKPDHGAEYRFPLPFFLSASESLAIPGVSLEEQEFVYSNMNEITYSADDTHTRTSPGLPRASEKWDDIGRSADFSACPSAFSSILSHVVAGGQVADNSNISSAQLPILEKLSGPDVGSYSNEGSVLELNFETTFFRPIYAKLSAIKSTYEPDECILSLAYDEVRRYMYIPEARDARSAPAPNTDFLYD
ncbi:hypothetical protein DFH07DRAFT_975226 [Mycena maculata]|uniref:Uncharacterized protein n=1 Tax=Mycena maculata TaxID=230809 RepID=A0AAD7KG14_9AGAR|nr:hypothetical protein DFH07DRAFT_975226 [Mycena maculata]